MIRFPNSSRSIALALALVGTACSGSPHAGAGTESPDAGSFPVTATQVVLQATIDSPARPEGATDCGPADLNGISFDDETYTLKPQSRELSWRVCERKLVGGAPAPFPPLAGSWSYRTGQKVLSEAELAKVQAALHAVHVTTPAALRVADVPFAIVTVTSSDGTSTYYDDFTADGPVPGKTFVHGLAGVFAVVTPLAN